MCLCASPLPHTLSLKTVGKKCPGVRMDKETEATGWFSLTVLPRWLPEKNFPAHQHRVGLGVGGGPTSPVSRCHSHVCTRVHACTLTTASCPGVQTGLRLRALSQGKSRKFRLRKRWPGGASSPVSSGREGGSSRLGVQSGRFLGFVTSSPARQAPRPRGFQEAPGSAVLGGAR